MDRSIIDSGTFDPAAHTKRAAQTRKVIEPESPREEALGALLSIATRISTVFEHGGTPPSAEDGEQVEEEPPYVLRAARSRQRPRKARQPLTPLEFQLRALALSFVDVVESLDSPAETARLLRFIENAVSGAQLAHAAGSITRAKRALGTATSPSAPGYAAVDAERVAADIVAIEQRCSVREGGLKVAAGIALPSKFPKVWAKVRRGELHASTGRKIADTLHDIVDPAKRAKIEALILNRMERDDSPLEWSRFVARHLDMLVTDIDPGAAKKAEEAALDSRRVSVRPSGKGMASLTAKLPALDCASVVARLRSSAEQWSKSDSDKRTRAQLEADALVQLLAGPAGPSGDQPKGPGVDKQSATIHPRITLLADVASGAMSIRGWAAGTSFIRERLDLLLDSVERAHLRVVPLGHDDAAPPFSALTLQLERFMDQLGQQCAYTPNPALRRAVIERDGTCRHPGCLHPAERCDLDHVVPFDHSHPLCGGLTREDNLIALCRSHHRFKTHGGGRYVLNPDGRVDAFIGEEAAGSSMPVGHRGIMRERAGIEYEEPQGSTSEEVMALKAAVSAVLDALSAFDSPPASEADGGGASAVVELRAHRRARETASRRSASRARCADPASVGAAALSLDELEL